MLRTRLIAGTTAGFVQSAVFATFMTLVNAGETFIEPWRIDPALPAPVTLRMPAITFPVGHRRLRTVAPVVPRGSVVTDPKIAMFVRLYESSRRPPQGGPLSGLWALYFLIAMLVTTYLRGFSPSRGALLRTQAGLLGLLVVLLVPAKAFLLLTVLPPYWAPVASVPLWIALYLERRTAFIVSLIVAFLMSSMLGFSLTSVAVFLTAGATATFVFRDRKHPTTMLVTGVVAGIASAFVLVAAKMLFEAQGGVNDDLSNPWRSEIVAAICGGIIGGGVAFALRSIVVVLLGAVSRDRLVDLTDLEQPLLVKMAKEAPGSWEHSRMMANLAEAAAASIHADSLLTRVGAYYHDLGKTCQPKYFVENLEAGEQSPHADLDPDVSADAIMSHVVEGTKLLRKEGVPEPVVEFTYTHHGTSVIEYFWHKCLEQGNPKNLPESFFRYPGMRPRTRETAILMIVDSVEAASRTIDPPTREKFEEMVHRILFVKTKQGQLDESGLTMEDLRVIANKLTDTLVSVRHARIRYPWQDATARGEQPLPIPGIATEQDMEREVAKAQAERDLEERAEQESADAAPGESPESPEPIQPAEATTPEGEDAVGTDGDARNGVSPNRSE